MRQITVSTWQEVQQHLSCPLTPRPLAAAGGVQGNSGRSHVPVATSGRLALQGLESPGALPALPAWNSSQESADVSLTSSYSGKPPTDGGTGPEPSGLLVSCLSCRHSPAPAGERWVGSRHSQDNGKTAWVAGG